MSDNELKHPEDASDTDMPRAAQASDSGNIESEASNASAETEDAETESSVAHTDAVTELVNLQERIAELEAENSELKDQFLRKQADFENYRKRAIREREEAVRYANQQLLLDLASVIDDFERAIKSAQDSEDFTAFHDGVVLIEKQLTGMLERKWGLSRFDSEGEEFDPQKHEAVSTEPREEHDQSIVLEDYQKGYLLHDRVIRSAKVKVSMPTAD